MAGGVSIWVAPEAKTDPKEIFNRRLLFLVLAVSWAGCFYGLDTGNIGGILTLESFQHAFGLDTLSQDALDSRKGNIAAMLAAGGSLGALLAAPASDFLGRRYSVLLFGIIFLIGAVLQMIANLGVLYAGRFIGGIGVGATSMLTPQFLAENSPRSVRGSLTAMYNLFILFSLSLAFWINYAVSKWSGPNLKFDNGQWRVALGIQLIPGTFMVVSILFVPETPRFLIAHGKSDKGLENLCKLRQLPADHPYVEVEFNETLAQVNHEQEARQGHSYLVVLKDIFTVKSNFRRFFLAVMLFLFHKFTGTDSLNYYAPEIFQLIGVAATDSLLTTGIYGVVKFVTTIFYVAVLVDRVGRRLPLIVGGIMQATSMLYLALIYIYAFGWSFGWSVAPYVAAAEIFPARIRSVSMAFCFFINWIVDYAITRATPSMITHMGWGVFLLYAVLTYIGAAFTWCCMPEFKGRSIESMDDLFKHSIWGMWRHAYPTEDEKVLREVADHMGHKEEDFGVVEQVEDATCGVEEPARHVKPS
ncbi:putative h(+) hexose cotransporter 1 [Coleophoma crateriformis]|uniref:Putative h(+) hexose cotransporter 1 n=1 Tax=Coleophoma crateriformis TaxID=565419 RepID=A0A3D8Q788_9HELO|nr:putative h(+) hexose cotransporter 1 [Coleophoma crateriformis]